MPSRAITGDVRAGQRLKLIRKHLNLTQEEFAAAIGVKQSMVSFMEKGQSDIPLFVIQILCTKHEISPKYIILGVGEMAANEAKEKVLKDEIRLMKVDIGIALDKITYLAEKLNLIEINKLNNK